MASAPETYDSAVEEVAVTLPTPKQTWFGQLTSRALGPRRLKKDDEKKPSAPLPSPSKRRLEESWAESSFGTCSILPPTVLYLAYGSNLCFETFQGRRGIKPISAVNVVVPELSLVFDLPGVPYLEPCFANSAHRKAPGSLGSVTLADVTDVMQPLLDTKEGSVALVGVVYEVTGDDYHKIIASEGPAYTDVVVECHALPPSEKADSLPKSFQAHTLLAPPHAIRPVNKAAPAQPSLRYLNLCRTGAAEHELPASWQNYLKGLPHYHTTSARQVIGKFLFVMTWAPLIMLSFGIRRLLGGKDGNASPFVRALTQSVFSMMWVSYDYFFKYVFGEGERGPE